MVKVDTKPLKIDQTQRAVKSGLENGKKEFFFPTPPREKRKLERLILCKSLKKPGSRRRIGNVM